MGVITKSHLNGKTVEMERIGYKTYRVKMAAPTDKVKYANDMEVYDLKITADADNGESSERTERLYVRGSNIFPLEFVTASPSGEELGYVTEFDSIDVDLGDTNDFELKMSLGSWSKDKFWHGNRFYIPGTEYGGLLEDLTVSTKSGEVTWMGYTWRGLLMQKIVEPPAGKDHLILNGELSQVIAQLVGERFGNLFVVDIVDTGITLTNWKVDRYVTLYDAVMKILENYGYRLDITYVQKEYTETVDGQPVPPAVHLRPVKVIDYSDSVEFSQDGKVYFTVQDYRRGINHLICAGTGQNEERIVLHLYVQADGSIGETQYHTGLAERTAIYDYSNADLDKLREDGVKKLKELMNYSSINLSVDDMDLELGDIVGGFEEVTETYVKQPIVGKILRMGSGSTTVEYEVKGEE